MINQDYTLHTHTVGFDGRNTVAEMVNRAREKGFKTIGISNHLIVHPNIKRTKMYTFAVNGGYANIYSADFNEAISKFIPHFYEIEKLQEKIPDIKILRGIEVDFFDNDYWKNGFKQVLRMLNPDYTIGSAHLVEYGGTLNNTHDWKNADSKNQEKMIEIYWDNVKKAAASGVFSWMAHLDLPKKVGLGLEDKWFEYESRAVDAIANAGGAIEINTSFYRDYLYEPYPSNRILKMVADKKIPVIISDDAHEIKNIGRHFDESYQLMQRLNLTQYQR